MDGKLTKDRVIFEIMLVVVVLGTSLLFIRMGEYRMVALNLFYVPVILSAFFLGRMSAGVLALFCALCVTVATSVTSSGFAAYDSPVLVGLVLTLWAAVLGLAAILTGTLCDQRSATVSELHKAYVGVVEVLSKYLQGANPRAKAKSVRIAELSQAVAEDFRLSQKEIDAIRVAALLHDLGHVEITTNVISKAVDSLETSDEKKHTFRGTELVHSLGTVLEGALPLLVNQDDAVHDYLIGEGKLELERLPLGARIIRTVRAYDDLAALSAEADTEDILQKLRARRADGHDDRVIEAIRRVKQERVSSPELAAV